MSENRVVELDPNPAIVITPPGNRAVTVESIADLLKSMEVEKQLVWGIVAPHPEKPGCWLCLDGNRRLLACRILGLPFKAVVFEGEVTDERLAITRIAANKIRQNMTDAELAGDLQRVMDSGHCSQGEAARRCGISPGEASKALSFPKRAAPELIEMAEKRTVCRDVARLIATLPSHEQQRDALDMAILNRMNREAVDELVQRLKGTVDRASKPLRGKTPGGLEYVLPKGDLERGLEECLALANAIRKAIRLKLPQASVPGFLRAKPMDSAPSLVLAESAELGEVAAM